jgi:nicotinamide riboside kinase
MTRIAFIGAAGSGKSTLAAQVFSALKQAGRRAEHIHEFVRNDINAHGPMTSIWEQYRTRQFQKELEDAVPDRADYIICDSGTLTPYFYAVLYSDPGNPRQRLVLQDMYKYLLDDLYLQRYDLVFYLPLFTTVDLSDGTRYQTEQELQILDQHMRLVFTKLHRLPNVHMVHASFEQRLEEVMWKILGVDKLTVLPLDDTMSRPKLVG